MQLTLDQPGNILFISTYSRRGFGIAGEHHAQSLTLTPDALEVHDAPMRLSDLDAALAETIVERAPDLVIVGTGGSLVFPELAFSATLMQAGIGCEVMATNAACRTYNVLAAESRDVMAVLMFDADAAPED